MHERTGNEEGSVSIEAALALSSLVVVSALIIGVLTTLALYVAAVGGAGAAARAHAIGETYHPPRGVVSFEEHGGLVTATVSIPATVGEVSASAVFPRETH
ncbi:hypothetical protein HMPREF0290_0503 [Corynebacterium efficiens YS-314]|uniref:hypothetical protein n=1 Tax=Corynebacterium efficiens TaxID=152794 RepID=UPI0001B86AD0|nr:hypothetical protein [Corynebacterium efficiens]EEW50923.1 hypothetical protein HMPREF0290_0503 [Corynebacterium efficiens YS-314]